MIRFSPMTTIRLRVVYSNKCLRSMMMGFLEIGGGRRRVSLIIYSIRNRDLSFDFFSKNSEEMRRTKQQQEHHPSFFKVLIGDFDKQLRIPLSFVASNVTRLPKSAVIETMISGNSRVHQAVTIEQVGKNHCFTTGWNELVKRFKLNAGDFAEFWLVSDTVFKAIFYGPNGCEKEISKARDDNYKANLSPKKEDKKAIPRRSMTKGSKRGYGACGKSFKVLMKKHRRYRMRLPLDFVTKSGIAGKNWVVLKNMKGEVWPVDLAVRSNGTDLTSGWADFRNANEIVEGRFCLFKFIEDNVILVKKL